ncbi:MAG: hypothetical protein WBC68_10245 [Albidovulum sp.]
MCGHLNSRWGHGTAFHAIRRGSYKLVRFQDVPPQVFNLADDPLEQVNMFEEASGAARVMCDQLLAEVDEADQTLCFQGVVTDEPGAFFADCPGDANDA